MELMNAKGTRDLGPEEKIIQQEIIESIKELYELNGFSPLETPIIERTDILSAKYDVGSEILKEMFTVNDQGERDLCLRYDMTVPLARYVGMNKDLKMPFKRYAIGPVFRDGPIAFGRFRQFWQCDADIIGSKSMLADAQCIEMLQTFFSKMGLSVVIELNNRKLLDGILDQLKIDKEKQSEMILAIDKLKKIGVEGVEKELKEKGMLTEQIDELLKILKTSGSNRDKLKSLRKMLDNPVALQGLDELEEILSYLVDQSNVLFSLGLARGFAYYTGSVCEVFMQDTNICDRSLAGGGRWDKMIGDFLGSKLITPAVGVSFGLSVILAVLKKTEKIKVRKSVTQVFVVPIKTKKESLAIVRQFREAGIRCDIDLNSRGISKNLDYANSLGMPYVVIVGPKELEQGKIKLKNMESGDEVDITIDEAIKSLIL